MLILLDLFYLSFFVVLALLKEYYDDLVIATGTSPRKIQSDVENPKNIYYLRSIDDVLEIKNKVNNAKKVAIIGGGFIGLEVAAIINKLGLDVTIIEMADRILERVTSQKISNFYTKVHNEVGVEILTNTSVQSLISSNKGVEI